MKSELRMKSITLFIINNDSNHKAVKALIRKFASFYLNANFYNEQAP